MAKLKISDLAKIKEQVTSDTNVREGGAQAKVTVHMGTCGIASGARAVLAAAMDELEKSGRKDVIITTSGCVGLCRAEPLVTVDMLGEESIRYSYVDDPKMRQIFNRHVLNEEVQTQWAFSRGSEKPLGE